VVERVEQCPRWIRAGADDLWPVVEVEPGRDDGAVEDLQRLCELSDRAPALGRRHRRPPPRQRRAGQAAADHVVGAEFAAMGDDPGVSERRW
jgi:hypothetical protein